MNNTPRTDANCWRETNSPAGEVVTASFARELERENAKLRAELEAARECSRRKDEALFVGAGNAQKVRPAVADYLRNALALTPESVAAEGKL